MPGFRQRCVDTDMEPVRDSRGRFVNNHPAINNHRLQPGEVRTPHPTLPNRDSKGRLLYGAATNMENQGRMGKLRRHLLEVTTPEQVQLVMEEVRHLATDKAAPPDIRLKAASLWLDRILGRPLAMNEISLTETKTSTAVEVKHHLHKLSDDELRQLTVIMEKVQPDPGHGTEIVVIDP